MLGMTVLISRCRSGAVKHPGVGRSDDVPKLSGHVDVGGPTRCSIGKAKSGGRCM